MLLFLFECPIAIISPGLKPIWIYAVTIMRNDNDTHTQRERERERENNEIMIKREECIQKRKEKRDT